MFMIIFMIILRGRAEGIGDEGGVAEGVGIGDGRDVSADLGPGFQTPR